MICGYLWGVHVVFISQGSKFISDINRWKGVILKDNDLIYLNCNHVIIVGGVWRRSYVRKILSFFYNYKKCKTQYELLISGLCCFAESMYYLTHTFPYCNNYFDSHVIMFRNSTQMVYFQSNKKVSYMK